MIPASALAELATTLAATEPLDVENGCMDAAGSSGPHTHLVGWPHSENMGNLPMCRGYEENRLIATGPRAHKLPK